MKTVILCPGQGAQAAGMGKAWFAASVAAREVFAKADAVMASIDGASAALGGHSLSQLCFEGPAEILNRTDVSQPAIYTCTLAAYAGMVEKWGGSGQSRELVATAGLSLGEYSALAIAGIFSFEDGLKLVALRGRAMQDAAVGVPSGMVALIGADEAQSQEVCNRALAQAGAGEVLVPANFNAPGQVVISGSKKSCEIAVTVASEMGLRATALVVAGAFHSPIMQPAAERLTKALSQTKMVKPTCQVASNVTGGMHTLTTRASVPEELPGVEAATLRRLLAEQLTSPVRWSSCCGSVIGHANSAAAAGAASSGELEYCEPSPGKTLAGLMRRIDKAVKVVSYDEPV
jgi:[acyl-carrier-protein] S-malonyltransferase